MENARAASIGVLAGVAVGARVAMLFAAVEAIAASWMTRLHVDGLLYSPQSTVSFAASILAHAFVGAIAGALLRGVAGPIARRTRVAAGAAMTSVATFAVVLVLLVDAATVPASNQIETKHVLILSLALEFAIVASWWRPKAWSWLSGVAAPWSGALLLGIAPWITHELIADSSWSIKRASVLGFAAALTAAATLAKRWLGAPRASGPLATAAVVLLALAGGLLPQATIEHPRGAVVPRDAPTVVLISLDTVRSDHLSVYGYERDTTPRLREFAANSTLFTHSYSSADFTLASHASLFTGLYARTHGAHPSPELAVSEPLAREHVTLTERLADAGWRTVGIVANYVMLGPVFGIEQGFERYDARARRLAFPKAGSWTLRARLQRLLYEFLPPEGFDLVFRRAGEINREVFARLDQHRERSPGSPLMLFVNYMDAHVPYAPPPPFVEKFAAAPPPMRKSDYYTWRAKLYRGDTALSPEYRAELVTQYDSSIAYLDAQVGALLERLQELGLYEGALIIVTADHGEAFGEHSTLEHEMSVYGEQVRVPLIVKLPHQRAGRIVETAASGVDVTPTVLAQLGLPPAQGAQGRDLFDTELTDDRIVFAEHYPTAWHTRNNPRRAVHQTAAFWGALKQIRYDDGRLELYDLAADPREERPIDGSPADAPDLAQELRGWTARPRPQGRDRRKIVEALESLGYAE